MNSSLTSPDSQLPITRSDAVLWFVRVFLWLRILTFVLSVCTIFWNAPLALVNLSNIIGEGVPVLILMVFPRALTSSVLGSTAPEPLHRTELRSLVSRCAGLALFVSSIGRAILLSLAVVQTSLPVASKVVLRTMYPYQLVFSWPGFVSTAFPLVAGFFLAFGPTIRDNFRFHP